MLLTAGRVEINLSASVDETFLIESGRGSGPLTPRQPVEAPLTSTTRCQFQPEPEVRFGKDEKSACFSPLLVLMRRGFLLPEIRPGRGDPRPPETTGEHGKCFLVERQVYGKKCWFHEGAQVPRVRPRISADRHARVRIRFRPARGRLRLRAHPAIINPIDGPVAAADDVALSRVAAGGERTDRGLPGGLHAAHPGRSIGPAPRRARSLGEERHGQLSDPFVQRPSGQRRLEPRARAWIHHRRLRFDRQSRQLRRCQRRRGGTQGLRVHSR